MLASRDITHTETPIVVVAQYTRFHLGVDIWDFPNQTHSAWNRIAWCDDTVKFDSHNSTCAKKCVSYFISLKRTMTMSYKMNVDSLRQLKTRFWLLLQENPLWVTLNEDIGDEMEYVRWKTGSLGITKGMESFKNTGAKRIWLGSISNRFLDLLCLA